MQIALKSLEYSRKKKKKKHSIFTNIISNISLQYISKYIEYIMNKYFKKILEFKNIMFLFLLLFLKMIVKSTFLYYFNNSRIIGQDRLFVMSEELEFTNYPMVVFNLEKEHDNLYDYFTDRYRPYINDKKSRMRLQLVNNNYYTYSTESTDEIMKYTFEKIDTVKDVDKTYIAKSTTKNSNKIKFLIANDGFIVSMSHLIHDGISTFNSIIKIMDINKQLKLPYYQYVPIYNETIMIKNIFKSFSFLNLKKNLSYDYPWKKSSNCKLVKSTTNVKIIKKLKKYISESYDHISFPVIFSAIQCLSIFNSTKKNCLTIAIVVGFKNDTRFNNFTALPVVIDRPDNWESLNSENFKNIAVDFINKLNKKIEENKHMVPTIYSLTNIYDITIQVNNYIDILFSGIPMCINHQQSIDGININKVSGTMPYHNMPIYVLYLSDFNNVHTTTHIRTNDVDISSLVEFNNNINQWLLTTCE